jgi:anti-anti-sigma factor
MNNSCEQKGKDMVLTLTGEQTIERAEELKSTLLEVLKNTDSLIIDLLQVVAIDFSCLQLLFAAQQTALAYNKELRLVGVESEVFKHLMDEGGFLGREDGLRLFDTKKINGGTE